MEVIWVAREAENFFDKGWTGFADLPVAPIGRMRRAALCACAKGKSAGSNSPDERSDVRDGRQPLPRISLRSSGLRLLTC
jgi:hypothetical protein